ncbi:D-aminoacyl-tRNA deacylase [Tindallia californiensis]|uniref:D-aminoacyl-tRNA deacylase n=1 Tax=Tindallia californiensis TaxID=159292 RepID=A0A1H3NEU2_9FIRM|nr:D-aminoacyl-tRNA deacylase [Tindallia californiensis]SDY87406.1 D-tyrosyl-tRNA(Tyr) deacylase [Tindallia californiensis]
MRAVVQRVKSSCVSVDDKVVGAISHGLLVYVGVGKEDSEKDIDYMAEKIVNLRIFEDEEGKMNQSLIDIQGEILCISQFTLWGDCRKGRRPSFTDAQEPKEADRFYKKFVETCREKGVKVETGVFQAHMEVSSVNDGPVTMLIDSAKNF